MADPRNRALRYRDDIDLASTWVVSDTHFGHNNIVGFCHRPEDHDQVMIAEWRKEVPDDATLLHLGDLVYKGNAFFKNIVAPELTGARKLLVKGNHDKSSMGFYRQCGFSLVRPFALLLRPTPGAGFRVVEPGKDGHDAERFFAYDDLVTVSFCHYAWSLGQDALPGEQRLHARHWRLHGHIHNNGYSRGPFAPFLKNHINLSVEQTKFRPVNLKVLLDAALLGRYEETTPEQAKEASRRKVNNLIEKEGLRHA